MGIQQWWFVWGGSDIWYWLFFNHTWDVGGGDKHILVMGQNHNLHASLEIVHSLFILCLGCSALSIDWLKMLCWYPLVKQFAIEHGHLVRWFTYWRLWFSSSQGNLPWFSGLFRCSGLWRLRKRHADVPMWPDGCGARSFLWNQQMLPGN